LLWGGGALILKKSLGLHENVRGFGYSRRASLIVRPQSFIDNFARTLSTLLSFGMAGNSFEKHETGGVLLVQIQRTAGPAFNHEYADAYFQGGRQCFG
jgi:hypothetical protein